MRVYLRICRASKGTTFGWGRRAVFVFSGIYFGQKSFIVSEEVSFPRKHAKISSSAIFVSSSAILKGTFLWRGNDVPQ